MKITAAPTAPIAGRYQIVGRIGSGGMGEVFRARDTVLNRNVAVKILSSGLASPAAVERFRAEAQAAARISHPNVVHVHDWGEAEDTRYMVMEYVRGRNLREVLSHHGQIPARQACKIMRQAMDGLAAAHAQGLVHRDVKPENLILSSEGVVKITDFGIARLVEGGAMTSGVMGTVAYVSPEQVRGEPLDPAADIYAAGCVLYELLTGSLPYSGEVASVLNQHLTARVPAPSDEVPEAAPLDAIVLSATQPDKQLRPSATSMGELLRSAEFRLPPAPPLADLTQELTSVVPESAHETIAAPPVPKKRVPLKWIVGAVLVLLFAVGAFFFRPTRVPEVAGKSEAAALDEIRTARLNVEIAREASDSQPLGTVLRTDPEDGRWAFPRSTVRVVISAGPRITDVPSLIGSTLDQAKASIKEAGLILGDVTEEHRSEPTGTVVDQDPKPGKVRRGDPVNLTVSKGPEVVEVPDVNGKPYQEAEAALASVGLSAVKEEVFNDAAPGTVIAQAPKARERVEKGSSVTLKTSKGPEPFAMPDVRNKPCSEAKSILEGRGLVVVVRSQSGGCGSNRVIEQDPLPGATVRKGQEATLYSG